MLCYFFFFKQKTAYEMRISDWISDVCSSDLVGKLIGRAHALPATSDRNLTAQFDDAIRRQAEIFHRAFRIAQHPREQLFTPDRHPRLARRDQRLDRKSVV